MSDYVILHGTGSGPDMWLPWLKDELEKKGAEVWMPIMPESQKPDLKKQLPFILESKKISDKTTLIGHSAACPLILSILEMIEKPIKRAVLVAGYFYSPKAEKVLEPIQQESYDWEKVKKSSRDFLWVTSDNDPWGCGEQMSRPFFEKLGGTFIVVHGAGHFGSNTFKSPLYEFPLLLKLIQ